MSIRDRWSPLITGALALLVTSTALADDAFVPQGVVVRPLSKSKQRRLEKKLLRQPGNKVVIEGMPTATPSPDAIAGMKSRRAFRPLFGDRFARRNDVIVGPPVVVTPGSTSPKVVVTGPKTDGLAADPQVIPGSIELTPPVRGSRPPVVSTPKGPTIPLTPLDEPDLDLDRINPARVLPPPADEIPPPVVSIPRAPAAPVPAPAPRPMPLPEPTPSPEPAPASEVKPSLDPGAPATPPITPTLEPPLEPRPA